VPALPSITTTRPSVRVLALDSVERPVDPIRGDLQVSDDGPGKGEADGLVVHGSAGLEAAWICR
jgi:hypothetical protein